MTQTRALVMAVLAGLVAAGCGDRTARPGTLQKPDQPERAVLAGCRVDLPADLAGIEALWATPIKAGRVTSAAARGNLVVVTTRNVVSVLGGREGFVEWSQSLGRKRIIEEWAPVVTDEAVHVFVENGIARFHRVEGTQDWILDLPKYIVVSARPAIVGETVYAPTWDGRVYALEVDSKDERIVLGSEGEEVQIPRRWFSKAWEQNVGDSVLAPVAARDAFLYMGTDSGVFAALPQIGPRASLRRGSYRLELGGRLRSQFCMREEHIYVGSTNYSLCCVNRFTGDKLWEFHSGREILSRPLADEETGVVFVISQDVGLNAVDAAKGTKLWARPGVKKLVGYGAEALYALDKDGSLLALKKKTGDLVWKSSLRGLRLFPCEEQFESEGKPLRLMAVTSANQVVCLVERGWRPPKPKIEEPRVIQLPMRAEGEGAAAPAAPAAANP